MEVQARGCLDPSLPYILAGSDILPLGGARQAIPGLLVRPSAWVGCIWLSTYGLRHLAFLVSRAEEAMMTHDVCFSYDLSCGRKMSLCPVILWARLGEVGLFCPSKCRQRSVGSRKSATSLKVLLVKGLKT